MSKISKSNASLGEGIGKLFQAGIIEPAIRLLYEAAKNTGNLTEFFDSFGDKVLKAYVVGGSARLTGKALVHKRT